MVVLIPRFVRGVHAGNRGEPLNTAMILVIATLLTFWMLAVGFGIGFAVRGTFLAGGIGAGVAAVVILIVVPLLRIWGTQRNAARTVTKQAP